MKLFLDTAHVAGIQQLISTGLIDGVTTNPTHLSKETGLPTEIVKEISKLLPEGEISVEVTERDPRAVYEQAKRIAQLAPNIMVKIPCLPIYIPIIAKLVEENIAINVTLVFSLTQGIAMAKLGVAYVSPFVGRLDDAAGDGSALVRNLVEAFDAYGYETEVLAASLRTVHHVSEAILSGAHAITVPLALFDKMLSHQLSEVGLEQFLADWHKLGIKQFP